MNKPVLGFGVRLPISGPMAGRASIEIVAERAEALGFDSLWVHDFIAWTRTLDRTHVSSGAIDVITPETEPILFESLITLAYVAAVTRRIRIGTSVLCIPYRQPIVAAKQIAALDVLSDGRLILGIGVGGTRRTNNQDFEILGIPRTEKYERTRDYLAAMRTIWTEPYPSHSGPFVSFPQTELNPKPVQDPLPIWMGGRGPKALEMAAELATGWLPTWLDVKGYLELLPQLEANLASRSRSLEGFTIAKECYACIADTDAEAQQMSRPTMETFSSGFTVTGLDAAQAASLIGSPSTIRARIEEFLDIGVGYFEMKFIYRTMDELLDQLGLFAREVIEPLREQASPTSRAAS